MSEKPLPFVVNDRRKFTPEGDARPDAPPPEVKQPRPETTLQAQTSDAEPEAAARSAEPPAASPGSGLEAAPGGSSPATDAADPGLQPPTPEEMEQARLAYTATAERLEIAIRASNPGMDHPPSMTFDALVQSVYMQAILQLGGGTQEGQQPQVDILGAKQSIEMLAILAEKTAGNLSPAEQRLVDSAVFELRLAFLEITQALARSAQSRAAQQQGPGGPMPGGPAARQGPSIVR